MEFFIWIFRPNPSVKKKIWIRIPRKKLHKRPKWGVHFCRVLHSNGQVYRYNGHCTVRHGFWSVKVIEDIPPVMGVSQGLWFIILG